ncbi:nucleoredoxin-like protein 2 [Octopus sinensis]|nr:nucleoredoxin-like protein 2 [Octopus sinensis]
MADIFRGHSVFRGESKVDVDSALKNKIVGIYFSASWCPPCRQFTLRLKEIYEELEGDEFEVVFLPFDHSKEDAMTYYKCNQGNWLYMEYGESLIDDLRKKFDVAGIPKLIILNKKSEVITKNGREDLQEHEAAVLKKWKENKEMKQIKGK